MNCKAEHALAACAFLALLAGLASAARAGCWAVYDEQYRQKLSNAFHASVPSRAGNFSSMEECRSAVQQMISDPQYRYDSGMKKTRCECDASYGSSGGGFQAPAGGTWQQQFVSTAVTSFLNGLVAALNAPPGPDGDAIRKEQQMKWEQEEKERLAAEKKAKEQAFAHAKRDALALIGSRPPGSAASPAPPVIDDGGVYIGSGTVPRLLRDSGIAPAEWEAARGWQSRIDELMRRRPLPPAEEKELAELEAKRNGLWKRSVQLPGLTQADRDAIRIRLFRQDAGAVEGTMEALISAREKPPESGDAHRSFFMPGLVEGSVSYGLQAAAEQGGEAYLEGLAAGKKVVKFGDAYAVGGAGVALYKGKPEEAAAPAVNWILGKLPLSAASVGTAQGVGAVTTTVVRKSWDHFLEETEKVVPGTLGPGGTEGFWKEMKEEATTGQKAVFEWLGM